MLGCNGLPPSRVASAAERELAAEQARARLCGVPFYAKRAEQARLAGDEMAYWRDLARPLGAFPQP